MAHDTPNASCRIEWGLGVDLIIPGPEVLDMGTSGPSINKKLFFLMPKKL